MFATSRILVLCAVGGLIVFSSGCGAGGAKPVPVSGKVTVDGQPVANVVVHFIALGDKHVGTGGKQSLFLRSPRATPRCRRDSFGSGNCGTSQTGFADSSKIP